jgi:L-malate glycosyltransferase
MRILIIPSWYPTPSNPVNGIFVRQQAEALGKAHDVRVLYLDVMPRGQRRRPKRYRNKTPGYTEEIIEVPNRLFLWQFTYLWYMLRSLLKLKREFKPDVIHSHVAVPAGWAVALLHPFLGVPIVLTEHTAEFDSWLKRPGQRWMAALAYGRADVVMPVSEGQRIRLQQSFRCRHRVEVVPNMVDTNRFTQTPFPPTQDGYRLLFVGLMETGQKGVPFLLEAISRIIEARQLRLHLDLVGGGKLLPEYKALAARQALNDFVTFHGIQPHAFIASLLAQTHALVLPRL